MAFALNLEFRGLCAFVPADPVPPDRGSGAFTISRMRVLLQDAQNGNEVAGHTICRHYPRLQVEQLTEPDRVIPLSGYRIDIDTGTLAAGQTGLTLKPSYWSVVKIGKANPGYTVDDRFLMEPPALPGVAASLRLLVGSVDGIDPSPQLLAFHQDKDNFARAVRVQVPIAGPTGSFTLTPFDGGASEVVQFTPKPGHTSVDAVISNLCDKRDAAPGQTFDSDFALYYLLAPGYAGPFVVPEPMEGQDQNPGEVQGEAIDPAFSCHQTETPANSLA